MGDEDLEAFWSGRETRQLFALDRRSADGALVYMEPGGADELRTRAAAGELICPIAGCPTPEFRTVGGAQRRHHFRHHTASKGGHDGESLAHHTAKHLFGRWANRQYPEARVVVDQDRVENKQQPDVLITLTDGTRFAIEVQYSAITPEAWLARHNGYRAQGIVDIWVLGHRPPHLKKSRREENRGNPHVSSLIQAIHAADLPLIWINPFAELLGVGLLNPRDDDRLRRSSASDFWGSVQLDVVPLTAATLDRHGLLTAALSAHRSMLAEHRARQRREEAKRKRRREAQRLHEEQEAARAERQRAWREQQERKAQAEWQRYRDNVVAPELGTVPSFITRPSPYDKLVRVGHASYWRGRIYMDLVNGRIGATFTYADASREFAAAQPDQRVPWSVISDFLLRLRAIGYLEFVVEPPAMIVNPIRVVGDTRHPPPVNRDSGPATRSASLTAGRAAQRSTVAPFPTVIPTTTAPPDPASTPPKSVRESVLPERLEQLRDTAGRREWENQKVKYIRSVRRVPDHLTEPSKLWRSLEGIHPPLWRHIILEEVVTDRVGERFTLSEACSALGFDPAPKLVERMVAEYLDRLYAESIIKAVDRDVYEVIGVVRPYKAADPAGHNAPSGQPASNRHRPTDIVGT